MKKLFIFLSTIFLAVMTMAAWAQENPKLSYQAVVRDNQNRLLTNSTVSVTINILKPDNAVQYTETFNSVPTNQNGLMSLLIGNKPSWDNVDWIKAKINVKITLPGGMGMVESTSDVSAVPLAISALYADSVNLGAVPQSDWDETNPAKCTFIKNKPNIPDTIKNQLADGNSVINHIVDTIVDNHIQWATDTLISNRELRDTAGILRGLIHAATGDVGDLAMRVDNFNRHVCDSVTGCVTGWIADSMEVVRDSIEDIRTDMGNMNDDILDSIANVNNHVRDTIRTINTALNHRIDTTSEQIRSSMHIADSTLQAGIDTVIDHLADTASTLRILIGTTNNSVLDSITRVNNHVRDTIRTINTALNTRIDTTASQSLLRDNALAERIRLDSIRLTEDSAYLKGLIDNLGNHTTKAALCDSVSDCVVAAMDSRHYLTSDSLVITTMQSSIATNTANISTNTTNISINAAAIVANTEKIATDSTDIMQNVSDTATAIRALITGASGDVGKLNAKVDSLNKNLFDTLHIKYVTNTVLADTIKDVCDSISALRDSIAKNYVTNDALCEKVAPCVNNQIQNLRDSVKNNTTAIYKDSVLFAGRIKNLSDSVKMNVKAIQDSSEHIREEIGSMNDDLIARLKADSIFQLKQDTILARSIKDTVAKHLADNSSAINNAVDTIVTNWIKKAEKDSLITTRELTDSLKNLRDNTISHVMDSVKALKDSVEHNYVSKTMLADTVKDVRDSISALRDSIAKNYVTNDALCEKVAPCVNNQIQNLRDSVKNNTTAIYKDSVLFAGRIKNLSDSVNTLYTHTTKAALRDSVAGQIHDSLSTFSSTLHTHANKIVLNATTASYTTEEQTKLAGIAAGAEVNVNASWTASSGDSMILNKPTTISGYGITDAKIDGGKVILGTDTVTVSEHAEFEALENRVNTFHANICDTVMACPEIQTMRDSIQKNNAAIAANATAISNEITNRTNADNDIKGIINADSIAIMQHVSDTATAIRALIMGAHGDVGKLDEKVDSLNKNLFDTLHIKYVTNTVLADTIKDVRDSISALRDSIVKNYVTNDALCEKVAPCVNNQMQNLRDSVKNNTTAIYKDSVLFADRIKDLSDSVKMNVKAIQDSSEHIREEIGSMNDDLIARLKADSIFQLKQDTILARSIKDTVAKHLADNSSAINNAVDTIVTNWIKKAEKDSLITTRELTDSLKNLRDNTISHVMDSVKALKDSVEHNYVSKTMLADTIKDVRDSISALRDSIVKNYVTNDALCEKVAPCVNNQIQNLRDSVKNNTTAIYKDSVLFADRIKDLSDSVKMNVKAIQDSSKHIREEIGSMNDDLIARLKADSLFQLKQDTILARSIKDTVAKHLANNSSAINNAVDTIAQNWIKAAAADSLISARELGDSLKNFREGTIANVLDSISALKDSVEHNYVSNSDLCTKVTTCVNSQISNLRDSVNTLYTHTTMAAIRDSVKGQINDSIKGLAIKSHTHANKDILDATTASYTTAEQTKLAGIADGAEVNVNADWTATSGDAQILNKPTTISGYGITDAKIDMTKKQVILGTDTLDVSDAAKDGKLTLKVNGDSIGSFSANQATNTEINIKCRQTSVRLKLTEETVDTLSVGMVLAIPTNFNAVDSVDHLIQLYINGVYVGDTVDGVLVYSNGKLTYDATKNDNKILVADERIQVVYWVK